MITKWQWGATGPTGVNNIAVRAVIITQNMANVEIQKRNRSCLISILKFDLKTMLLKTIMIDQNCCLWWPSSPMPSWSRNSTDLYFWYLFVVVNKYVQIQKTWKSTEQSATPCQDESSSQGVDVGEIWWCATVHYWWRRPIGFCQETDIHFHF